MPDVRSVFGEKVSQGFYINVEVNREEAARYGATAIIQPGGSMRDQEVIDTANRLGLAMVLTGVRHFRH